MSTSFTIATSGLLAPRRWFWVRIHDTLPDLHRAARRYSGIDHRDVEACCTTVVEDISPRSPVGVIRFARTHLSVDNVAHELVHAASAVLRLNRRVAYGWEEHLAELVGELTADLHRNIPAEVKGW